MVNINGMKKNVAGMTFEQYLKMTKYNLNRIAVERNGDIVPKANYSSTIFRDDDIVEVVSFVGGG